MSDNMKNVTPNPNPTANGQGNGNNNGNNGQAQQKPDNFIVAGFKRAKNAVSNGWNAIKASPWTHALCAFGGTVGGGYLGYKLAESLRPPVSTPEPVPQIPEPVKTEDEQTTETRVEYVDIPETTPATEEQ